MTPVINGSLIVPLNPSRSDYDKLSCGLLDVITLGYKRGGLASDTAIQIKEDTKQYKGTLLYFHSRFNVYGIVRDSIKKDKPTLNWVHGKHVEMIKDFLINYNERLNIIDISDEPIEVFKGKYRPDIFSSTRITTDKLGVQISYEDFIKTLPKEAKPMPVVQGGQSNIVVDTVVDKKDTEVNDVEEHNDNIESTPCNENITEVETVKEQRVENDTTEVNSKDNKDDEEANIGSENKKSFTEKEERTKSNCESITENSELMKALIEATKALNETREELKRTTESYKETMAKSFGDFDLDVEAKFVGVNDIKGSLAETAGNEVFADSIGTESVYEFILKIMKVDDSISLPRTFYEKLTTVIKRNMMLSRDGNKYDSIVLIRFDKASRDNLVARVEYDITKDYTRVTIIKQFNSIELTNNQMLDYETKFNQWRRMHSYRMS